MKEILNLYRANVLECIKSLKIYDFIDDKTMDNILNKSLNLAVDDINMCIDFDTKSVAKLKAQRKKKKQRMLNADMKNVESDYSLMHKSFNAINEYSKNEDNNIKKILDSIDNWCSDKDKMLSEYIFMNKKSKVVIKNHLIWDCRILFEEYYLKYENTDINNYDFRLDNMRFPIDTSNRVKFNEDTYQCTYGNSFMIMKLDKQILKRNEIDKKLLDANFSVFNDIDFKIFNYIIKTGLKNDSFFTNGKLIMSLREICLNAFNYDNPTIREKIRMSIYKMQAMSATIYTDEGSNITSRLLLAGDVYLKKNFNNVDEDTVVVTIGDKYLQELIAGNIIEIHHDILDGLEDNLDAKHLIFDLQKERIIHYYQRRDNNESCLEPYEKTVPYTFFSEALLFTNKRKDRNKRRIDACLNIICNSNVILEGFERKGDYYNLKFKPMSIEEQEDIVEMSKKHLKLAESHKNKIDKTNNYVLLNGGN